ncbi:MAG: hypothetical protein ACRDQB_08990 [Thermocrispum sp.]
MSSGRPRVRRSGEWAVVVRGAMGVMAVRFILLVEASVESEAGVPPEPALMAEMQRHNEAGVGDLIGTALLRRLRG